MVDYFKNIFDTLSIGVVILNKDARIKYMNKNMRGLIKNDCTDYKHLGRLFGDTFTCIHTRNTNKSCRETGRCGDCPLKAPMKKMLDFSDIESFEKEFYISSIAEEKIVTYEVVLKTIKNNNENDILMELFPLNKEKNNKININYENIEKEKKKIEKKIYKDALTKIYNRNFYEDKKVFFDKLNQKISFILLDIDNFKKINDSLGHLVGDEVLKNIAEIIQKNLNEDAKAIRMGGDEFLVILQNSNEEVYQIAKRIKNDAKKIDISMSVGIVNKKDNELIDELYERADEALYMAKNNGKDKIIIKY